MKNECMNVALIITTGAVVVFFLMLGSVTLNAYRRGFAEGVSEASERFQRAIKAAKAEKLFRGLLDDLDRLDP